MRVVLVDPSRTMRLFVTRLLEARDHEVRPCADGAEALACMRQDTEVAALITSGELGAMSGLELCWETRVLAGRDRPIYVILMSSSIDKSKLGEALDSGADDFISKPPVPDELYARLRAAERLGTMQRELVRLASFDPLTGLHNRRVFFERAESASQRCPMATAIMLDIDHFKRINDRFGHEAGDQVLREVAALLRRVARKSDVACRHGGEEFLLLMPEATPGGTLAKAEEVRGEVERLVINYSGQSLGGITVSVGIAMYPRQGKTAAVLLRRADEALFAAKRGGRNRVLVSTSTDIGAPMAGTTA
jgi:two-component system cell cycle response regulator